MPYFAYTTENPFRVLSLGGGVQSTVMALLADAGRIEGGGPDIAIHADTQWDPPSTLATVRWLASSVGFPVQVVTQGSLFEHIEAASDEGGFVQAPLFSVDDRGRKGMGARQCTYNYKLRPLYRASRAAAGAKPYQNLPPGSIEHWIGISTDEVSRMKDSRERWQKARWPLIELGMSRDDCRAYWDEHAPPGAPPLERSACVGCPLHSQDDWVRMFERWPEQAAEAVRLDEKIRHAAPGRTQYLHQARIPLRQAVQRDDLEAGDMMELECEGMCGV